MEHGAGSESCALNNGAGSGTRFKCGEFVPDVDETAELFPDTPDLQHLFAIPQELKCLTMTTCRLVPPEVLKGRHGPLVVLHDGDRRLLAVDLGG